MKNEQENSNLGQKYSIDNGFIRSKQQLILILFTSVIDVMANGS